MFKGLIFLIAMATIGRAGVVGVTPTENMTNGIGGVPATLTYALNQALTGTSSTAIDLSGTSGIWLSLSSTGNALVKVYFSNGNLTYTTGAIEMYSLTSPGSYAIAPRARYVSFYNYSASSSGTAVKTSAFYSKIQPATSTVSGAVTVSGLAVSFQYASSTAIQVTTAGLAVNLSTVAGVATGPFRVYFSTRESQGFYWDYGSSATVPAGASLGSYTAASVTATSDDPLAEGTIVYFRPTTASTVNAFITVLKPKL